MCKDEEIPLDCLATAHDHRLRSVFARGAVPLKPTRKPRRACPAHNILNYEYKNARVHPHVVTRSMNSVCIPFCAVFTIATAPLQVVAVQFFWPENVFFH